jgi:hypothetical protein
MLPAQFIQGIKMKLLILHLSDIHISSPADPILSRIDLLAEAVRSVSSGVERCIIALTGDIAYSGSKFEYEIAKSFLKNLQEAISSLSASRPDHQVQEITIAISPLTLTCDESSLDRRNCSARYQMKPMSPFLAHAFLYRLIFFPFSSTLIPT